AQLEQKNYIDFSAHVSSEDDGERVLFRLYIDYGFPDDPYGRPYRDVVRTIDSLEPSTTSTNSRPMKPARWFPNSNSPGYGCHNVTLIASHSFDDDRTGCPVCRSDSSQITWQVIFCDPAKNTCESDFSTCRPEEW